MEMVLYLGHLDIITATKRADQCPSPLQSGRDANYHVFDIGGDRAPAS